MYPSSVSQLSSYAFLLHLLIVTQSEPTKQKQSGIDEFIEASNKRRPVDSLSCHVCHSETDSSCHNLTLDKDGVFGYPRDCDKNATYCMVRKFSFTLTDENQTSPMKTFGIKRNCTGKCEPGCVIMGERTRLYVCNSCCTGNMCNVGSGSEQTSLNSQLWVQSIGLILQIFFYFPYTNTSYKTTLLLLIKS